MRKSMIGLILMLFVSPLAYGSFGGSGFGDGSGSGSGSGTVNTGTTNQVGYYATTGTAVSGSNNFVFTGTNVGIGSANPQSALDVAGTITASTINTGSGTLTMTGTTGIALDPTGGGNKIFVDTSGNVGIGSATPGSLLDVINGDVRILGTGNLISNGGNTGVGTSAVSNGKLLVMGGNVGIGTTIPKVGLHYIGTSGEVLFDNVATDATTKGMHFGNSANTNSQVPFFWAVSTASSSANTITIGGGTSAGQAATSVIFNTASAVNTTTGTQAMRITNGNVGIGTATVSNRFVVYNAGSSIGWGVQSGANTACNTTCTNHGACVFGEDTSVIGTFVACTDATADVCICAGP